MKTLPASTDPSNRWSARDLRPPKKEVRYDEYDGNNEQRVDPIAGFWETWTYSPTESAKQPKYYQNYDDNP